MGNEDGKRTEMSVVEALHLLHDDGDVVELRIIGKPTYSGYFMVGQDDETIAHWEREMGNMTIYQTMNHVNDAYYSRSQHCVMVATPKETTGDDGVDQIKWILIDCDPIRASGISASDEEKEYAHKKAQAVYIGLQRGGFKDPIIADSGNGYHLLYKVDVDATPERVETLKNFLTYMDMVFGDDKVSIDTAVFNPSRITKLYGTTARKGANTAGRPWRKSGIVFKPETIEGTRWSMVEAVANSIPKPEQNQKSGYRKAESFDIHNFLSAHGIGYREGRAGGLCSEKLLLDECPFCSDHKAPDSAIFVMQSGAIGFRCLHNSCQGKTWRDVRIKYDPDAYSKAPYVTERSGHLLADRPHPAETVDGTELIDITAVNMEDKSKVQTIRSGFKDLDMLLWGDESGGFSKGDVTVWTGRNGTGKSTVISQIALEAANQGFVTDIYSGELSDGRFKQWLYLQAAGKENVQKEEKSDFYRPKDYMIPRIDKGLKDKIFLYNNEKGSSSSQIIGAIRTHIAKRKEQGKRVDVIILDNLMAISYDGDKSYGEYDEQFKLMREVRDLAREENVHVHFVCHPKKNDGSLLSRYDISGSSHLSDLASNVIAIYRGNMDSFHKKVEEKYGKDPTQLPYGYKDRCDNYLQLLKCRWNGKHIDGMASLYMCQECKTLSERPGIGHLYGWQENPADEDPETQPRQEQTQDGYVIVEDAVLPF